MANILTKRESCNLSNLSVHSESEKVGTRQSITKNSQSEQFFSVHSVMLCYTFRI